MVSDPYITSIFELEPHRRPGHRYRCSKTSEVAALGKIVCSNGAIQYKAYCLECGGKGAPFTYGEVDGLDPDRIPILRSHDVVPCERCGSEEGSEVHHWAPIHLFEDAEDWPMSHLCRKCHMEWHRVVTPLMTSSKAATGDQKWQN